MARRKSPNTIDSSAVRSDVRERLSWMECEYKTLAAQRNMFAFLYNKAKASMANGERDSEKMAEWRRECWRIEYIMRWLNEKYHAESLKLLEQAELSNEWGKQIGLLDGEAGQLGL
jgi:IS4 transposase